MKVIKNSYRLYMSYGKNKNKCITDVKMFWIFRAMYSKVHSFKTTQNKHRFIVQTKHFHFQTASLSVIMFCY